MALKGFPPRIGEALSDSALILKEGWLGVALLCDVPTRATNIAIDSPADAVFCYPDDGFKIAAATVTESVDFVASVTLSGFGVDRAMKGIAVSCLLDLYEHPYLLFFLLAKSTKARYSLASRVTWLA